MKLLVFFSLVALLPASSASPLDTRGSTERLDDLSGYRKIALNGINEPPVAIVQLRQKRQVQLLPVVPVKGSFLEWVTWNGALPDDAVSVYNDYESRTDYVCKYKSHAGFYTSTEGVSSCNYADGKKEHKSDVFEILVNKDNFEILEWRDGSRGSVPPNSVRTCPGGGIYVGKNKYGLGKVDTKNKHFYLPWKGSQYDYKDYQVLTVNDKLTESQLIDTVRYITNESNTFQFPPETIHKTTITNHECHSVVKKDVLTKTYEGTQRWDFGSSDRDDFKADLRVNIPLILNFGYELGEELFLQQSKGHTVTDIITDSISMDTPTPPNHSCSVSMMRHKYKVTIPFTARLSRTYITGEIRTTPINGTYSIVHVGEVQAVVDRCERLKDANKCT